VNDAEQFIRRATRGLWGKRRVEAQGELRSHIYERTQYHLQLGSNEQDALTRTLRDLGDPRAVHLGLLRIHSLPLLMTLALMGAVVTGVVSTLVQAKPIVIQGGSHFVQDGRHQFERVDGVYVRLSDLKAALPRTAHLTRIQIGLAVYLPGMVRPITLLNMVGSILQQGSNAENPLVNLTDLTRELSQTGVVVDVGGWERPTIRLGAVELDLDPGTNRAVVAELYGTELLSRTQSWSASSGALLWRIGPRDIGVRHTLALKARPGEVFALLVPQKVEKMNSSFGGVLNYGIGAAGADGSVTFTLPAFARRIHVTGDLQALERAVAALNQGPADSALAEMYPAVVIRLTGKLNSTDKRPMPMNVDLRSTVP